MALTENFTAPALANAVDTDLITMRANWRFLFLNSVGGGKVAPGWTTVMASASSPQDFSKPDSMTLSRTDTTVSPNVTEQYKFTYTWTGVNATTIVCAYDDGTGFVTVTGGTLTLTYDGLNNFSGCTSA